VSLFDSPKRLCRRGPSTSHASPLPVSILSEVGDELPIVLLSALHPTFCSYVSLKYHLERGKVQTHLRPLVSFSFVWKLLL